MQDAHLEIGHVRNPGMRAGQVRDTEAQCEAHKASRDGKSRREIGSGEEEFPLEHVTRRLGCRV